MSLKSTAAQAANTFDIVTHIVSYIDTPHDLASLLRTSPTFFQAAGPKLYRRITISNERNPLLGADQEYDPDYAEDYGPYDKDVLLWHVREVYIERTELWFWELPWCERVNAYPLPNLTTVTVEPVSYAKLPHSTYDSVENDFSLPCPHLIHGLCANATRLCLSSLSQKGFVNLIVGLISLLHEVTTLDLKVRVQDLRDLASIRPLLDAQEVEEVNLYIWDEIFPTREVIPTDDDDLSDHIVWLGLRNFAMLSDIGEIILKFLDIPSLFSLQIYNLRQVVGRYTSEVEESFNTGPGFPGGARDALMELAGFFEQVEKEPTMLSEHANPELELSYPSAKEWYDDEAWDGRWAPGEQEYYERVINPSEKMLDLRQKLGRRMGRKEKCFVYLSEEQLERIWDVVTAKSPIHPLDRAVFTPREYRERTFISDMWMHLTDSLLDLRRVDRYR
ncbi:hypothetical protein, variant [Cryptococcus amylolentus CBS 6039]|uniref:Uncharacterized protein n=2 Tax=Cryptococcus amylolentus TaxID=104669 RepID=A0A1E3H8Q0_9TREE|nr:hypothetical protein L202_08148 [Cryptococcus amylolentus CBS 6039]XP_018988651.1 hypothetical protein, variant [Cryptococcus amylolentus CBS 6039]ODN72709.1 hypothetical protein L202_08148 [Cryptococcus amylolentus CBS 6039]ODN72710.1 hypothetical protein, variant [Cryptococcus amylolentus CBS 6039]ODN97917.1 hypothetical protein I350_07553 [Cryptococcus amylolentus CBS 6273]